MSHHLNEFVDNVMRCVSPSELHAGRNFVTAARNFNKYCSRPGPRPAILIDPTRGPALKPHPARKNPEHLLCSINFRAPYKVRIDKADEYFNKLVH